MAASTATRSIVQKLGNAVKEVARSKCSSWWYTPHMAAASRAIAERIPLVDFVLEVRDARIPLSSECNQVSGLLPSSRHIIILNKIDLAKQSEMKAFIYNVKTDIKAQTITIEGVIEQEKLLTYMRKRVHKYAEIIPPKEKKEDKRDEKKEKEKVEIIKVTEKAVEFKQVEKVGAKTKEGDTPYFVHFVYAPQLFSDENPHACSVM